MQDRRSTGKIIFFTDFFFGPLFIHEIRIGLNKDGNVKVPTLYQLEYYTKYKVHKRVPVKLLVQSLQRMILSSFHEN